MDNNIKIYLEFYNNYLTINRLAEHYGISAQDARAAVDAGRVEYETLCNRIKVLGVDIKALQWCFEHNLNPLPAVRKRYPGLSVDFSRDEPDPAGVVVEVNGGWLLIKERERM